MDGSLRPRSTLGTGTVNSEAFAAFGEGSVFEAGSRVFHPERLRVGAGVYLGHDLFLHAYHDGEIHIEDGCWIGPGCYMHGAGGIHIGRCVGIGPGVRILSSEHAAEDRTQPVLHAPLRFAPVRVEADADLGTGAILLPGVTVGRGCIVGAGAVVTRSLPDFTVAAGSPARILRTR